MSGSIIRGLTDESAGLGEFRKYGLFGDLGTPLQKQSDSGTLLTITRMGTWCVFESDRFCQESRCSDCIICEEHQ